MYNHKFGFHINAINNPVAAAITRLQPHVIKTLHHDVNFWRQVRRLYPKTFIIGRLYDPYQKFDDDPVKRGREFADRILREEVNRFQVDGRPIYDAWESFNEVMPESAPDDLQKRYNDFQVAFGLKMKAEGLEPVGMNFSTGNLLGSHLLKNFRGVLETYKYIGFHEYDWPTMDRLHKIGLADGNGGMWLCLRYRRIMEEVRREYPDRHIAIVTECGMSQGVVGRADVGPWHYSHPISPDDYWKTLQWYNSELMKDDYLLGACLFVVGAISPWESFEHLGPMMDRLADFQKVMPDKIEPAAQPEAATSPAEIPAENENRAGGSTPPSGNVPADSVTVTYPKAVANYHSHYVLFPAGTKEWWYAAARPYLSIFGATRGEKLPDALLLRGAQGQTITCINPKPETLDAIKQQAPTVQIDVISAASPDELAEILAGRLERNAPY